MPTETKPTCATTMTTQDTNTKAEAPRVSEEN